MTTLCDFLEKQLNKKVNLFEYKNQKIKENQHIINFNNINYVIEVVEENNIEKINGYTYLFFQNNFEFNLLEKVLNNFFDEIKTTDEDIKIIDMNDFLVLVSKNKINMNSSTLDIVETETYKNTSIINLGKIKDINEFNLKFNLVKNLQKYFLKDENINKITNFNDLIIYNIINICNEDFFRLIKSDKFKLIDENLISTGINFIENDLNISKTSNNLYLHRNTLNYRLDKIKEIFDLDLKNFKDALIFYISAKRFLYFDNK